MRVLVTGASGYVGKKLIAALAPEVGQRGRIRALVASDVREVPIPERQPGVTYETLDIRSDALPERVVSHAPDVVVHLASVVSPPQGATREFLHDVDVKGTERLLKACIAANTKRIVVTSSGAAYGYDPANAPLLDEEHPLRGHRQFAYADHKRQVEELLARARREHPNLRQLVLRLGTVLGEGTRNQITDMFDKPFVLGIAEAASPFNFIWDEDVVRLLSMVVLNDVEGTFNVAGDGVMTLAEIAHALGKRYVPLRASIVERLLGVLHPRGLSQYGPEQVAFLRYRPVMSNERLVRELGFRPAKNTREVLELYREARRSSRASRPDDDTKVVVVTGAASGIGLAIARRFARSGARVAMLDRDPDRLAHAASEVRREGGGGVLHAVCDVADWDACAAAVNDVVARFGGIDVVINNAGISHRSLLAATDPSVLRRVMDVNYFGAVNITRAALQSVRARKGSIVAISSIAGFAPLIGRTGYAASKHALHGFFDSLRAELEPDGVHVMLVCPSYTNTNIDRAALAGDGTRASESKSTIGRMASADEVAAAVERGVARRRRMLVLSPIGKASYALSRLLPRAYERAMRRTVRADFA